MLSSNKKVRRKVGVFSVQKPKPGKAGDAGKGRRPADPQKGKVLVLRQGSRKGVQSKCSGDRACAWPVVNRGLCIFHLRDLYG
jgi:hypothetical protein